MVFLLVCHAVQLGAGKACDLMLVVWKKVFWGEEKEATGWHVVYSWWQETHWAFCHFSSN